jgi:hypothetical protein
LKEERNLPLLDSKPLQSSKKKKKKPKKTKEEKRPLSIKKEEKPSIQRSLFTPEEDLPPPMERVEPIQALLNSDLKKRKEVWSRYTYLIKWVPQTERKLLFSKQYDLNRIVKTVSCLSLGVYKEIVEEKNRRVKRQNFLPPSDSFERHVYFTSFLLCLHEAIEEKYRDKTKSDNLFVTFRLFLFQRIDEVDLMDSFIAEHTVIHSLLGRSSQKWLLAQLEEYER